MLALIILHAALGAQQPQCPRASRDTAALALSALEQRPVADSANAPPAFPSLLRQAGIGGSVPVTFSIDTNGRVEAATIRIVRSPNPGFDAFVKRAVATWRFTPASLCGRRVRVRMSHEFAFRAVSADTSRLAALFEVDTSVTASTDTLPDGTPRTTLGWRSSPVVVSPVAWDSIAGDSAEEALHAVLVHGLRPEKDSLTRIVCIEGRTRDSDPDRARLLRLTEPGIAVLPLRRCPPTLVSMIYVPGSRPLPPGDDPSHIRVLTRKAISPARMLFDVDVARSAGGTRYQCGVERRTTGWHAVCLVVSHWVS